MIPKLFLKFLTFIVIIIISSASFASELFQGKVIGITDGDTIKILYDNKQIKIRLYGIDTPEKKQAFGNKAKKFTSEAIFGKIVTVIKIEYDRYGRTIALIQAINRNETLNESLVVNGYAWVYRKYCKADFCSNWIEYEKLANFLKLDFGKVKILFPHGNSEEKNNIRKKYSGCSC